MSERYQDFSKAAAINWSAKETVDSMTEALHYFCHIHKDRGYSKLDCSVGGLRGRRGRICNIVDMHFNITTGLQVVIQAVYRYYVMYNRSYLRRGPSMFERAPKNLNYNWQTVHTKIIQAASLDDYTGPLKDRTCIVIVMQDKTVWYIQPLLMKKFVFEYETEDMPRGEQETEGHIPTGIPQMISQLDPFRRPDP